MKESFKYILIIIFLYLYLHNPLFTFAGGMGAIKLLYPIAMILIISKLNLFKTYFQANKKLWSILLSILGYTSLLAVMSGGFMSIYSAIVAILELLFVPFIFVVCINNLRCKNEYTLIKMLGVVGVLSVLITIACIINPTVNTVMKSLMVYDQDDYWFSHNIRGFGLSSGLFYEYGIILAVISLLYYIHGKYKLILYVFLPLVVISILFNARTGLVVLAIGFAGILLKNNIGKGVISLIFIGLGVFVFIELLPRLGINDESANWVSDFFEEIKIIVSTRDLAEGDTTGTLTGSMFVLPQDFVSWIFGTGENIYLAKTNSSDVGYIIQLNFGGIIYCCLLLRLVWYVFKQSRNISPSIAIVFAITFLIGNMKGQFLINSGGFRLFILYIIVYNQLMLNGIQQSKVGIVKS